VVSVFSCCFCLCLCFLLLLFLFLFVLLFLWFCIYLFDLANQQCVACFAFGGSLTYLHSLVAKGLGALGPFVIFQLAE